MKDFLKKNLEAIVCYGFCALLIVAGFFVYKMVF